MSEPFLGTIVGFAGNFAPRGWALCQGQILSISQNTALFSLLGTTYGGNGQTTFALPDLRGRTPVSSGQGPGLSNYDLGQSGGEESVVLNAAQMPAHTHQVLGSSVATGGRPNGRTPATGGQYGNANDVTMDPGMIQAAGGSQPHDNMPPHLAINYIIALQGIFPSRN